MTQDFDALFRPSGGWAKRVAGDDPSASVAPQETAEDQQGGEYRAYGFVPSDDLHACEVSWWLTHDVPQGQEFQYRYLVRVGFVGDDQLHLMLTDCIIAIEGKHLHDLRKRLSRGKVTFIQAFNPKRWPKPPDTEPIIEKVQLLYPGEPGVRELGEDAVTR